MERAQVPSVLRVSATALCIMYFVEIGHVFEQMAFHAYGLDNHVDLFACQ